MKKLFRKQQRKVNKIVRKYNKSLEEDEAFRGRIYIRQYSAGFHEFSDGSGGFWYGVLRVYDKVTNTYKSILGDIHGIEYEMYSEVNQFITRNLKINIYRATALGIDYRDMPHDPSEAEPFYDYDDKNFSYKNYG